VKKLVFWMASLKVTNDSRIWASCLLRTCFLMWADSCSPERTSADWRRAYDRVGLQGARELVSH